MGYLMLDRKIFRHHFWNESRTFSKAEAWIDLIQSARFEADTEQVNGKWIKVDRGEVCRSIRYLEKRWCWGNTKVRNFLTNLEKNGMITRFTTQGETVVKLCKYDSYNLGREDSNTGATQRQHSDNTPATQRQHKKKKGKEGKELKNTSVEVLEKFNFKNSLIAYGFEEKLVNDWLLVRKNRKATNTETAFKGFVRRVSASGMDKNEVLSICVEKSWSSFQKEWLDNLKNNQNGTSKNTSASTGETIGAQNFD